MSELPKSSQAFRTISEVSEDLSVPQHVLRFWETKFSSIRPLKRGGNRRYYRPEDIQLLRAINKLLYVDGYTIRGVQKLIREKGVREIAALHGGPLPAADAQGTGTDDITAEAVSESFDDTVAMAPPASPLLEAEIINTPRMEFEPDPSIEQPTLFMPFPVREDHKKEITEAIAKLQRVRANIQSALGQAG